MAAEEKFGHDRAQKPQRWRAVIGIEAKRNRKGAGAADPHPKLNRRERKEHREIIREIQTF